jgi:hypothetical protein
MKQGSRGQPSATEVHVHLEVRTPQAAQAAAWRELWHRLLATPPAGIKGGSSVETNNAASVDETEAASA